MKTKHLLLAIAMLNFSMLLAQTSLSRLPQSSNSSLDAYQDVESIETKLVSNDLTQNNLRQETDRNTNMLITTFPYTETFDSGIGDWMQDSGDDGNWTLDANGTPSNNTGPSDDISIGGNYFYTEASVNGLDTNATVYLSSPTFDLQSTNDLYVSFYYHMFGASVGSLSLEISVDDGLNWTSLFTQNGNQGNLWYSESVSLQNYANQLVKFRFVGITGADFRSDIAIDQFSINQAPYCPSNGNDTREEYIGNVSLNTINNTSLEGITSNGYSNFTTINTNLKLNSNYTISVTPIWTGTVYNEAYSVWIDYNADGDFDDSGEQVFTQSPTAATVVSGNFTIPSTAPLGQTRMRVSMKWNAIPNACESFTFGEVEDYSITLIAGDFCDSQGTDTSEEFISNVQLNTINNTSGAGTTSNGFSDFTAINTMLSLNSEYTISITPEWTGTIYNEGYAVWIDYNADGDFEDTGEEVFTQTPTTNTLVSGNFIIPLDNILVGETRMRVAMKYNGIPTPCEAFTYGEVEDYSITIGYDGLLYNDNTWTPSVPSDTTGTTNALVLNGQYTITDNSSVNDLFVHTNAELLLNQGQALTINGDIINNGTVALCSDSTEYSSLIVTGGVTGTVNYKRHVNTNAGGNDLIAPPVSGQEFADFAIANPNIVSNDDNTLYLFGPFDKVSESYITYANTETATLDAGVGYRAASTDDGTFTFTGQVSTGTVSVPILNTGSIYPEWNLIGNPYTSYIKLSDFLANNNSQFDMDSAGIYGYDGDASDGWTIWNQAYAEANPEAIITPGQGFLVASASGGGTVNFTSNMQAHGNADDFITGRQNTNAIAYLRLQMSIDESLYKTEFYFSDNASLGLDQGYDAAVFGGQASSTAIFSQLVEANQGLDMAIQAIHNDDVNATVSIPLGMNINAGQQVEISMPETTLAENVSVYLHDTLTNTYALLNEGDYTFTTTEDLNGIGRFYLQFEVETLSTINHHLNSLQIYNIHTPKQLFIKGQLNEKTYATMYDVQGHQVLSKVLDTSSTSQQVDLSSLITGVYVVQLKSATQTRSKKLIIK